jgi:hypothetical protein
MPILVCSFAVREGQASPSALETQPRVLWNEQEHMNEEHELVY